MDMPVNMAIYAQPFEYKGMKVFVQPIDYNTLNKQNLETFEQQRLITMVNDADLNAEEKQRRFTDIFRTMTSYTLANIVGSIEKIVTPEGVVVNNESHINDFVRNTERQFYEALKNYMDEIAKAIPEKTVTTNCAECNEQYSTPFTFDQSNFFVFAS